jgi:hypothetical protein
MNDLEIFILPIAKELDNLQSFGFQPHTKTTTVKGWNLHIWEKPLGWKKNAIQLICDKYNPTSCRIDFHVYLKGEDLYHLLTGISLSNFVRKQFEYKFPVLFKKMKASSTVEKIVKDVFEHLNWFDRYDKKVCLSPIKEGNPSETIGIRPTGLVYPAIEKRLLEP